MDCCATGVLERQFGPKRAAADLRRYRTRGPLPVTSLLLRVLEPHIPPGATLLDVGGGVGVLHHELLDRGISRAWAVEPSAAFLRAAADEAVRRGHAGRVEFIHADLRRAPGLPRADVVAMDRVVCCDPDFAGLLGAALDRSALVFAYTYPRARRRVRLVTSLHNAVRRLKGTEFRVYVHPPERMEAVVRGGGFVPVHHVQTATWCAAVYTRAAAGGAEPAASDG